MLRLFVRPAAGSWLLPIMRALAPVLIATLAFGCGATPRTVEQAPPPVPRAPAATSAAQPGLRPESTAGLYWIPYTTCPDGDCAQPAALVAYVTPDERTARRIKAALDGTLAFGLPWVIHTDQLDDGGSRLAVTRSGIAIVIGTFATRDAAASVAAKARRITGERATVIDIAAATTADSLGETAHSVTVVDRGRPVPAWSAREIAAIYEKLDNGDYQGDREAELARELHGHTPLCMVNPGELFLFRVKDLKWYELAPVRCRNEPAYIPWTSSLLGHAVIVPDKHGYRLYQVVGAACDSPDIRDWRYDEQGRHSEQEPATMMASAGC